MSDTLHSLSYVSRSRLGGTPEELAVELEAIVKSARARNALLGVTGALLYSGGCFEQVIEGDRASVESIFESVSTDRRHFDVTIVHYAPIQQRSFDGWPMAFSGDGSLPPGHPLLGT